MLRAIAIVLGVGLVVLAGMSFLVVSNLQDQMRALRTQVDDLESASRAVARPPAEASFDLETPPFAAVEDGGTAPVAIVLPGGAPRMAVVALTEAVGADGSRTPVVAPPVVLVPGAAAEMPVGRDAGCLTAAGAPPGAWVFSLDGTSLRVASRGCYYARPVKGRLRGLLTR